MPDENQQNGALYRPCANCGDLRPPDARLCPHCGAVTPSGSPLVSTGLAVLRFLFAAAVAVIALPLGACGAAGVLFGVLYQNLVVVAFGAGGVALAAGLVWAITRILREHPGKGEEQR